MDDSKILDKKVMIIEMIFALVLCLILCFILAFFAPHLSAGLTFLIPLFFYILAVIVSIRKRISNLSIRVIIFGIILGLAIIKYDLMIENYSSVGEAFASVSVIVTCYGFIIATIVALIEDKRKNLLKL